MKRFLLHFSIAVCLFSPFLLPSTARAQSASVGGAIRDPTDEAQTGHPYDIFGRTDANHIGEFARVSQIGGTEQPAGTDKTFTGPAVSSIFTTPFDVQPNTGKNAFYGPGLVNVDMATLKDTALTEKLKLQFRFEVYNLFNHAQFSQPNNIFDPQDATFGESLSTITRPDGTTSARQIQFALKLIF